MSPAEEDRNLELLRIRKALERIANALEAQVMQRPFDESIGSEGASPEFGAAYISRIERIVGQEKTNG